jgi:adenylosuccinate synthase
MLTVVSGLSWGDEGKGSSVDFICRQQSAKLVVRFSGGAQAGHRVVTHDGREHIFSQFGSGTFAGAATHCSRYMMINPITFLAEERYLAKDCGIKNAFSRVTIEDGALITTPFHVAANRLVEIARDAGRHGSCGMGVGETMKDSLTFGRGSADVVTAGDLRSLPSLRSKLKRIQERKRSEVDAAGGRVSASSLGVPEWEILSSERFIDIALTEYATFLATGVSIVDEAWLTSLLLREPSAVFEGAQGVLLDQDWGFHPHTTWSDCTWANAERLIPRNLRDQVRRWGVLRTFSTRHGSGPFPVEADPFPDYARGDHNTFNLWQHNFRAGPFDLVLAKYAVDVMSGIDGLVLTHLDRIEKMEHVPMSTSYIVPETETSLFEMSEGKAERIIPTKKEEVQNLIRQERIGKVLHSAKPQVCELPSKAFAPLLAEVLGVPLRMTSSGPTAKDKALH